MNELEKQMESLTYEQATARLEELVQSLEKGDLSLEDSLNAFEEAVKLINFCKKLLTRAGQRISILTENDSDFKLAEISFPEGPENDN